MTPRKVLSQPPSNLRDVLLACANGEPEAARAAAVLIESLGPDALERAISEVEPGIDDLFRWRRFCLRTTLALMGLSALGIVAATWGVPLNGPIPTGEHPWLTILVMLGFFFINPGAFIALGWNVTLSYYRNKKLARLGASRGLQLRQGALFALAALATPAAIGPLLMVDKGIAGISDEAVTAARRGLVRALKKLSPEDGLMLTPDERRAMYNLLVEHSIFLIDPPSDSEGRAAGMPKTGLDLPLSRALIHAYTIVGDEKAAARIKRLTRTARNTGPAREVAEAAEKALTAVQERAEWDKLQMENTLVRPADAAEDTLLRPVFHSEPEPAEQLLRPSAGPGDEREG